MIVLYCSESRPNEALGGINKSLQVSRKNRAENYSGEAKIKENLGLSRYQAVDGKY